MKERMHSCLCEYVYGSCWLRGAGSGGGGVGEVRGWGLLAWSVCVVTHCMAHIHTGSPGTCRSLGRGPEKHQTQPPPHTESDCYT